MMVDGSQSAEALADFVQERLIPGQDKVVILLLEEMLPAQVRKVFSGHLFSQTRSTYYDVLAQVLSAFPDLDSAYKSRLLTLCKTFRMKVHWVPARASLMEILADECLYADMVLLGSWQIPGSKWVNRAEALITLHCPIVVLPDYKTKAKQLILLYDKHPFSLDAIKQFNYLLGDRFPEHPITLVLHLADELNPDEELHLMDYVNVHMPSVGLLRFSAYEADKLERFLQQNSDALMVTSAESEQFMHQLLGTDFRATQLFVAEPHERVAL